jgi:hypothetical protein
MSLASATGSLRASQTSEAGYMSPLPTDLDAVRTT